MGDFGSGPGRGNRGLPLRRATFKVRGLCDSKLVMEIQGERIKIETGKTIANDEQLMEEVTSYLDSRHMVLESEYLPKGRVWFPKRPNGTGVVYRID